MRRVVVPSPEAGNKELELARNLTLTVYVLHALASATFVTFFVAVFINYSRRQRVAGTIYESHFEWQISTFWYTLLYLGLGTAFLIWALIQVLRGTTAWGEAAIGLLILLFNVGWHFYRVIRGLMRWSDRKPMPFRA
jgi:uncharacterized membrane protein